MFERPKSGERAILVHMDQDQGPEELRQALQEFRLLAESAGAELLVIFSERGRILMEQRLDTQLVTLVAGIAMFIILTVVSYRISANRFEQVDV